MTTNTADIAAGPLARIKVLDLCIARAGPTCVRVLADHGAQVTQVVRPGGGGDVHLPAFDRENLHRNKRSIAINLQTDAGREVLYRLVKDADVVVENYRADVKKRLGIDYETLRGINPRIILASLSGFGQDGPYSGRPGVDQIAQGLGGLMSVTGQAGTGPWRVGIPIADLTSGLYLAHGVMAAIIERETSGEGQWVQTSLLEAMIAMMDFQATNWLIAGEIPGQAGNDHPNGFPTGVFPTRDGAINIAASGERMWRDFLKVIGAEEIGDDERFATPKGRSVLRAELRALVEPHLREKDSAYWVEAFSKAGVPCGPILSVDKVFEDPQVKHLEMVTTIESPMSGTLNIVRSPTRLSRTPTAIRTAAPKPGSSTSEVLAEAGYNDAEIAQLLEDGVIEQTDGSTPRKDNW
ncbi:MAG: CaiB/BaiF CoA transferase family protein [Dehalococcoidia bacterium]